MGAIKQLAGETVVYGGSTILGRLLSYLLVILYTKVFLPSDYGVVTELMSYAGFFNVVYLYGMETGFFRFASKEGVRKYFNLCFTMVLSTGLLFSILLILFATHIVDALDYSGQEIWVYMLSVIFLVDAIAAIPFAKLRLEGRAVKFASIKIAGIILTILLNLLFLLLVPILIEKGALGAFASYFESVPLVSYIFLSNLIANGIMLLLLFSELRHVELGFDKTTTKKLFGYSLPILLIGLAGMTNENLSRLLLKHLLPEGIHGGFTSQEALGIFGACYKLSIFMTLAVQAFRFASEPFFFSKSEDKNSPALFSQVMTAFVIFGSLVVYFVSINVHWVAPFFLKDEDYLTGLAVVPILLIANMFLGIYYNLSVWYKLTDKTMYGAYIAVFGAIMSICLNIVLIPKYGYLGSAFATLCTYGSMSVVSAAIGRRHFPVPYETLKIIGYVVIASALTFVMNEYTGESVIDTVARNLVGFVVFGMVISLLERSAIKSFLKSRA